MACELHGVFLTTALHLCNRTSTVAVVLLSQPFQELLGEVPVAFLVRPCCTLVGMTHLSNPFFQVIFNPLTPKNAAPFDPLKVFPEFDMT